MIIVQNPQLRLAHDFVHFTDRNIFLTGKAGTGKTTFLHHLKESSSKRMAVVAPTGVAAINAGGVTIHSFFQLPFGPMLPEGFRGDLGAAAKKFNREKIRLIQGLDLLVIDEISMVRADLLDGIDHVLRRFRDASLPFGGLQLLMIGDLHQLPPVAKNEEWELLKGYYETPYFFSSRSLRQSNPISIELTHIFRQTDETFINLLNSIRENKMDETVLQEINKRYIPGFSPKEEEAYITLTTHNATAQDINRQKLASLAPRPSVFAATISGDFPQHAYPTETSLELKPGAQVMFVKNDPQKQYFNGKIGSVQKIEGATVFVKCPGEEGLIEVIPVEWSNIKYSLDEASKDVKEDKIGTFTQYPLRLAWAITIHKSQGLTFERAIIDAGGAFAHGQVYVALSRCKTLEGVVLRSRITLSSVKTDSIISRFSLDMQEHGPDEALLQEAKRRFQQSLIYELFDFLNVDNKIGYCEKLALEHSNTLPETMIPALQQIAAQADQDLFSKAEKFREHLMAYFEEEILPEAHTILQERIKKAGAYYEDKMALLLKSLVQDVVIESDNKAVKAAVTEALEKLEQECFSKLTVFKACKNGFQTTAYLHAKANAVLDFKTARKGYDVRKVSPGSPAHTVLGNELRAWRDALAEEKNIPAYMILPSRTIKPILQFLPVTWEELEAIKGMGKIKMMQYGSAILDIIREYISANHINVPQGRTVLPNILEENRKVDSKNISLGLWRQGKTIDEIALERKLAASTIEGHLAHYVGTGDLDVHELLAVEKITRITIYFETNGIPASMTEAKAALGDTITYEDLRMMKLYLERQKPAGVAGA